jgi:hypothetical protein
VRSQDKGFHGLKQRPRPRLCFHNTRAPSTWKYSHPKTTGSRDTCQTFPPTPEPRSKPASWLSGCCNARTSPPASQAITFQHRHRPAPPWKRTKRPRRTRAAKEPVLTSHPASCHMQHEAFGGLNTASVSQCGIPRNRPSTNPLLREEGSKHSIPDPRDKSAKNRIGPPRPSEGAGLFFSCRPGGGTRANRLPVSRHFVLLTCVCWCHCEAEPGWDARYCR